MSWLEGASRVPRVRHASNAGPQLAGVEITKPGHHRHTVTVHRHAHRRLHAARRASGGRVRGTFLESKIPGGGFQSGRGGYLSVPEVRYLAGQYRARNLTSMAMIFMHDDEMDTLEEQIEVADWLRANEPSLVRHESSDDASGRMRDVVCESSLYSVNI